MAVSKTEVVRSPNAYTFNTLGFETITPLGAIGAGLSAQTSIQASFNFPVNYKIIKVGVSLTAIDSTAGTDLFNLVVGNTLAYTSSAASAPQNDNSFAPTLQGGTGAEPGLGYPTNVAVIGNTVFGADVALTVANFPNLATATGGYNTFPNTSTPTIMPSYDAVYPGGIPLTLRLTTTAGTGSITNFSLCLLVEPQTPRVFWFIPSLPKVDVPTPGQSF